MKKLLLIPNGTKIGIYHEKPYGVWEGDRFVIQYDGTDCEIIITQVKQDNDSDVLKCWFDWI